MRFVVVVDELPVRAGIDPFNKLVDRNSDDNCKRVKETTPAEIPLDETPASGVRRAEPARRQSTL